MSTTTQSPAPAPVPASAKRSKPTGWIVATVSAACLALVGMIAAVFLAFAPAQAQTPVTPSAPAHTTVIVHHKTKHTNVTPSHPVTPAKPVAPKVTPSDSIKLEQQQLGELNYYEGPINGYYTQATIDAVKCLQRDAGLPQTGQMDSATQAALTTMLINGNNQMAG